MELLLSILADLARLGSVALLLWGMVLCAMYSLGEEIDEQLDSSPRSGIGAVVGRFHASL